jgi:hypothetical protein
MILWPYVTSFGRKIFMLFGAMKPELMKSELTGLQQVYLASDGINRVTQNQFDRRPPLRRMHLISITNLLNY